ncbi:MAG: polymer-forming cytoskeletal protein [candidate division NC10 bacterium]|jgi:cytoskeletal protein CcmA (bactofilin family)|nr:polymer-forming cytoskeletal protein [candidate division NC10 bacterium]MCH7895367.1 polymer-forming cytoskeletal protein [candidate division NC10 bacterium]MCZ6551982.1 polymer-forming cytoskeletal protein [candidate division NC10 bacterium]
MGRERDGREIGEIKAFLGEGTEFKGVLSFQGTVRIDGRFEGEILGDELLVVGEQGVVRATVDVGTLVSNGRIEGTIRAKERVELLASSTVIGKISTPCLVVMDGATLNGTCDMGALDEVAALPPGEGSGAGT